VPDELRELTAGSYNVGRFVELLPDHTYYFLVHTANSVWTLEPVTEIEGRKAILKLTEEK
jgi:hypothetical protein